MKRRDFIEHVSWSGAGIAWTLSSTGTLHKPRLRALASCFKNR